MTAEQQRRDDTGQHPQASHSAPRPCTEPFYAVGGLDPDFSLPLRTPRKPGIFSRLGAGWRRATASR